MTEPTSPMPAPGATVLTVMPIGRRTCNCPCLKCLEAASGNGGRHCRGPQCY